MPTFFYKIRTAHAPSRLGLLAAALGLIFTLNALQSKAIFDDTGIIRTTEAVGVGDDLEVQIDDAEWSYDVSNAAAGKKILLVDDDTTASSWPTTAKEPALRFILQGLQNIGFKPDPSAECDAATPLYWDTASAKCNSAFPNPAGTATGAPSTATLSKYDLVIWFTGSASGAGSTLASSEVTDLTAFLSGGGNLLLASHGLLDDVAGCADGVGGADVSCAGAPHSSFISTYLGVTDYSSEARGGGLAFTRPIDFKDLGGDMVGGGQTWTSRTWAGYKESFINELTPSATGKTVLEETDASFGTGSPDNVIITRTDDGTSRVIFASNFLTNAQNRTDPDNFRSLFARMIKYLAAAPTVDVTNTRTGESETITLTNNGLGVLTGSVATSAAAGIAGDLVMNDLKPGDRLVTTYAETSPAAGTLTATTNVIKIDPVMIENSSGTPLTTVSVPGTFYVRVIDQDANTTAAVDSMSITVTGSSGDAESVVVTETAATSGIFLSSPIPTVLNDTGPGDGKLKVGAADTVDVSYSYLGAEVKRSFKQTDWHAGTTDSVPGIPADLTGFEERDDQTNIDSDEQEYFINDDGGVLAGDWQRNDFPPNPNPIITGNFEGPGSASDALGAGSPSVLRESSTGEYYLWYEGTKAGSPDTKTIHLAISKKGTSPIGRDFEKQPSVTSYGPVFPLGPAGSFYECGAEEPNVIVDSTKPFGTAGHFVMFFTGLSTTLPGDCSPSLPDSTDYHDIGRTTSADGLTWTTPASVLSVTSPGPAWDDGRVQDPAVLLIGATYHMWYSGAAAPFSGAYSIGHATSADGISWTKSGVALSPTASELDDASVSSPSIAYDASTGKYVMYYAFSNSGSCTTSLLSGIARAESSGPAGPWTKPAAPAEQAALCSAPLGSYENTVLSSLSIFTEWELGGVSDPSLIIDPKDGIDRLYFGVPGEAGDAIGVAWNVAGSPTGQLHTNPLDTTTPGYTTTGFGGFNWQRLGHFSELRARTGNVLSDLLYDPLPGVAFPSSVKLTNGALLNNAADVVNGQKYLQLEAKIDQDTTGPIIDFSAAHSGFIFSDALENFAVDVFQRPDLTQALSLPVEVVATDAVVRITDATFTQDPQTWQAHYDINDSLDQTAKTVVDVNGGEVNPGDQLNYRITVKNSSGQTIHGVKVTDQVPLGTTYLTGSIFGLGSDDNANPQLVWNIGDLAAFAGEVIGFSVIVDSNIGHGSEILNQAYMNSVETGIVPTDDPTTTTPRDPTILPVGARLLIWLALAALLAAVPVITRYKLFGRKKSLKSLAGATPAKSLKLVLFVGLTVGFFGLPLTSAVHAQIVGTANNMYFEVADMDQNTDSALKESVAATLATGEGDQESIVLSESDIDSGIFRGTMRAVLDPDQIAGDGLLEVEPQSTVTLKYDDQFNTSGSSIVRTDQAQIKVDHLYNISLITTRPTLLPGGGQQADLTARLLDIFGRRAPDGTLINYQTSSGSIVPSTSTTIRGQAAATFTDQTIINPTLLTAQTTNNNFTDTGRLSLTTDVTGGLSGTGKSKTLPGPADINLPGGSGAPPPNFTRPPSTGPLDLSPAQASQNFYQKLSDFIERLNNNTRLKKSVDIVGNIVAPLVAGLAALNLLLAAAAASWYPFLLRIFLEPVQILLRRRGKSWGVVYDSLTKQPIDLAIVRLYDFTTDKLVATRVTDRHGRYGFLVKPGEYYIVVAKKDVVFPSGLLAAIQYDDNYPNLYYGKRFKVLGDTFVHKNIPVDRVNARVAASRVIGLHIKKTVHTIVAYSGIILGLLAYLYTRTNLVLALLILHLVIFWLFKRLVRGPLARPWGVVYDQNTKHPLKRAVVRIFDTKYQRMLEQQVTDRKGRFGFLVGRNEYRLDAVKENYVFPAKRKTRPRDYLGGPINLPEQKALVVVDIPLVRKKDDSS